MKDITYDIIGCAYEVHKVLGPGLLESVYHKALVQELKSKGFKVTSEVPIDIMYKGVFVGTELKADIIVDDSVVIELKSVEDLQPVHYKQSYLTIQQSKVG